VTLSQFNAEILGTSPVWSGVPIQFGDLMFVPLHIRDMRTHRFPGWEHIWASETSGGDIEYHTYRRADEGVVGLSQVPQSVAGLGTVDLWGAVPTDASGTSA
jgi:hypothetical protein